MKTDDKLEEQTGRNGSSQQAFVIFEMRGDILANGSGYGKEVMDLREVEAELMESGRLLR